MITVIIHVLGLGLITQKAILFYGDTEKHRHPTATFAVAVGTVALLATILHALETGIWAIAFRLMGTMPDFRSAMLYSLGAMTSYGHQNLVLEDRWRLMGPISVSMDGCSLDYPLLFSLANSGGLTEESAPTLGWLQPHIQRTSRSERLSIYAVRLDACKEIVRPGSAIPRTPSRGNETVSIPRKMAFGLRCRVVKSHSCFSYVWPAFDKFWLVGNGNPKLGTTSRNGMQSKISVDELDPFTHAN